MKNVTPVIDMVEIGAGGCSIAGVDQLDRITVGPQSAGSEPGRHVTAAGGRTRRLVKTTVLPVKPARINARMMSTMMDNCQERR